ncbi:DUF29 domain-containing protein [Methylobacterium brachiatum]|uniref:DUF29 domain-containing protein n=1 Tax=Methylobacterium brachiatum TaxID=269660 RepID=UPI000EFD774C|nr:DUF29 domain-containing protein [Methylobacterium brachiatum]AYO83418.1 DUF29 domain-containing protein [Methylobacterium brachiatum]CAA2160419.1 hypothetical protein MBRA_05579 [Methylobacterium brachiatum]
MAKAALKPPPKDDLYETDFFLWTQAQADLLRARRFDELDLDHLIDEVASVGASDKREIRNRLTVLITHLLKWKYQPGFRSSSWKGTIAEQRAGLAELLDASPSLRRYPSDVFAMCYLSGRRKASEQTGIDFTLFPEHPPFTLENALSDGFLPKEPDLIDQS